MHHMTAQMHAQHKPIHLKKNLKSHLYLKGATAAMRGDSLPAGPVFVPFTWDLDTVVPLLPLPRASIFIRCFWKSLWTAVDVSQITFPLVGLRRAWPACCSREYSTTSLSRLLKWWWPDLQFVLECLSGSMNSSWGNEPLRRLFLNGIISRLGTCGLLWAERGANDGLFVPPDVPCVLCEDWALHPVPLSNSFEINTEDMDEAEEDNEDVPPGSWFWAAGPSKALLKPLVSCSERLVRLRGRGIPEPLWDLVFRFTPPLMVQEDQQMELWERTWSDLTVR